jgi:hypothetical protein
VDNRRDHGVAEPRQYARIERVQHFAAETAEDLAAAVNAWLEESGEKLVIQRDYLVGTEYVCFITYTE